MTCPHCGSTQHQVKAGLHGGNQRYKCALCLRRYTPDPRPRGYSDEIREQALQLHTQGINIRQIGRQLDINPRSIVNWVHQKEKSKKESAPQIMVSSRLNSVPLKKSVTPGKRRSTINDVATQAGVSIATISNYLNNKGRMSEATRTRVQAAMESLHFTPSALVRAIRQRRTHILGVLIFGITTLDENVGGALAPPILSGIDHAAYSAEHDILLYTGWPNSRQGHSSTRFLSGHIDGLIWVVPEREDAILANGKTIFETVVAAGLPVIAVLTRLVPEGAGYVNADNLGAMHLLVRHLTGLGHKRIAYYGDIDTSNMLDRRDGYREAIAAAGLIPCTALEIIHNEVWQKESYERALNKWLGLPAPPTAIILPSDGLAGEMMAAIRKRGLRIPEDIAVTGFDDIPDAARLGGGLTTIHQPFRQIGLAAVERLLALIEGAPIEECRLTLPTELVIRASTVGTRHSKRK